MTVPYRKKLIEVALPLEAINKASAREKSIRHGHPSTLHLWWARRPLAACRAVLFASLVDDPDSDPHYKMPDGTILESAAAKRSDLFNLIEELVQWENSNNNNVIRSARAEIARCVASRLIETGKLTKNAAVGQGVTAQNLVERCHCRPRFMGIDKKLERSRYHLDVDRLPPAEVVNAFLAEHAPPVLDPFCGGGSIPLEAQRLGLRAYASDLNPVPVLITKALIEIPPKFAGRPPVNPDWQKKSQEEKAATVWHGAQGLAADVRYYGQWMRDEAEKRIGHLYPKVKITKEMAKDRPDLKEYVGEELTVIAWLWARTVRCPNPACGVFTPIAKTFQLSGKPRNEAYVEPVIERTQHKVEFRVHRGQDKTRPGNVNRRGAQCLICEGLIPLEHIRSEAIKGSVAQQMMAIVAEGTRNRVYLSPTNVQLLAVQQAMSKDAWAPSTALPEHALGFRVQRYGMTTHAGLFSHRQLVALTTFSDLVKEGANRVRSQQSDEAYATALAVYLAFAMSKAANYWSSLCSWYVNLEKMVSTFGLPTLSMVWDFAEANPFSDSSGNWSLGIEQAASCLERICTSVQSGNTSQRDAAKSPIEIKPPPVVSTDPPYYDNIGYAALSDFFYIWLRRTLSDIDPQLFSTLLTPKDAELIAEPGRFGNDHSKAIEHFETGLGQAFQRIHDGANVSYPVTVFYAFKQQEGDSTDDTDGEALASSGWEKMLAALIAAQFSIHGTWPIRTEQTGGLREAKRNALASSIALVCRSRPADAPLATRKQFITTLRQELPDALRNLQQGNIAPVDLAQAAIGPGMAAFTRFAKVMESDGSAMSVRTALGLINQSLDEVLAEQEGEFDAETRWSLAWFEQYGMNEGPFGTAETLSRAKNTAVNGLVAAGIIEAEGGKVRFWKRAELPEGWDPATDKRLTAWEVTQYLIRSLESEGESVAAALVRKLGGIAETARDLAYRLYSICERKKWAEEALAYNGLVIAWSELTKLALAERNRVVETQEVMF